VSTLAGIAKRESASSFSLLNVEQEFANANSAAQRRISIRISREQSFVLTKCHKDLVRQDGIERSKVKCGPAGGRRRGLRAETKDPLSHSCRIPSPESVVSITGLRLVCVVTALQERLTNRCTDFFATPTHNTRPTYGASVLSLLKG
jgi:hypothetical protein